MTSRRGFITGLIAFAAAPAIVRAASLMPVKVWDLPGERYEAYTSYFEWKPPTIYCNRTIRTYLDFAAIKDKNILLMEDSFCGIPIRLVEELRT